MICCGPFYRQAVWPEIQTLKSIFKNDFPLDPIKQDILETFCSSVGHISMACLGLRLIFFDS